MKLVEAKIPEALKELIERINYNKIKQQDIVLLKIFAEEFLKQKGLLYEKENEKKKK